MLRHQTAIDRIYCSTLVQLFNFIKETSEEPFIVPDVSTEHPEYSHWVDNMILAKMQSSESLNERIDSAIAENRPGETIDDIIDTVSKLYFLWISGEGLKNDVGSF